jgi:hypothetical protein
MVIPASYKAASRGDDVLEGASVDTDLQNTRVECHSGTGLLDVVVLPERELGSR